MHESAHLACLEGGVLASGLHKLPDGVVLLVHYLCEFLLADHYGGTVVQAGTLERLEPLCHLLVLPLLLLFLPYGLSHMLQQHITLDACACDAVGQPDRLTLAEEFVHGALGLLKPCCLLLQRLLQFGPEVAVAPVIHLSQIEVEGITLIEHQIVFRLYLLHGILLLLLYVPLLRLFIAPVGRLEDVVHQAYGHRVILLLQ